MSEYSEAVIAAGTAMLAIVTAVLAWYTYRLYESTSSAQPVVTLEPNGWIGNWLELHLVNEGGASAFGIKIFTIPVLFQRYAPGVRPLHEISVLRPGQLIKTIVCQYEEMPSENIVFQISWALRPNGRRYILEYPFDISYMKHNVRLGSDPIYQIADHMEKIRASIEKTSERIESIGKLASGGGIGDVSS